MISKLARSALFFSLATLFCAPAYSDVEVNVHKDKVLLVDGSEFECIIVGVTSKGILVVEVDEKDSEKTRQRFIETGQVKQIVSGKLDGSIADFQTNPELANKVISGSGTRKDKKDKEKVEPVPPAKPAPVPAPEPETKPPEKSVKVEPPDTPITEKAPEKSVPIPPLDTEARPESKPIAVSNLSAKELADSYMGAFPDLRVNAETFVGVDGVARALEEAQKDPAMRAQVEEFLKGYLDSGESVLSDNPNAINAKIGKHGVITRTPKVPKKEPKAPK